MQIFIKSASPMRKSTPLFSTEIKPPLILMEDQVMFRKIMPTT